MKKLINFLYLRTYKILSIICHYDLIACYFIEHVLYIVIKLVEVIKFYASIFRAFLNVVSTLLNYSYNLKTTIKRQTKPFKQNKKGFFKISKN